MINYKVVNMNHKSAICYDMETRLLLLFLNYTELVSFKEEGNLFTQNKSSNSMPLSNESISSFEKFMKT